MSDDWAEADLNQYFSECNIGENLLGIQFTRAILNQSV